MFVKRGGSRGSPLRSLENVVQLEKVKDETFSQEEPPKKGRTDGGAGDSLSTPVRGGRKGDNAFMPFTASPPVFSMDALNDVLGQFIDDDQNTQFSLGRMDEQVDQKFCLNDISTIEQNAESAANALFNATQTMNLSEIMGFSSPPRNGNREHPYQRERRPRATATSTSVGLSTPTQSSSSFLPQLAHPLMESLFSPLTSPIYPLVVDNDEKSVRGNDGGYSSDSNGGTEPCSDSEFELDRDSSSSSDDTSDSDFNADDSESEFGARRRRGMGTGKRGRRPGNGKTYGGAGSRKQPYHHKAKSKDQVDLIMGGHKPLATKQINAHQLEAIAATMGSSPVTVNWLLQNYETSEGNSLPRALMYGHYLRHCAELRLDPVNAASFGKLIRSVFVGLTTRRLGTRGNSKYHYCGIRIKDTSTLLLEDPDLSKKTRSNGKRSKKQQILAMQGVGICGLGGNKGLTLDLDSGGQIDYKSVKKYLGSRSPCFPAIDLDWKQYSPEGITQPDLLYFFDIYKKHCWEMMEAMELFKLHNLVTVWNRFWQQGWCELNNSPVGIPKELLLTITKIPDIQYAIQHWDAFTYDQILTILMPNVIGQVPFQLLEEYHKFILTLREGLGSALISYDPLFAQLKFQLLDSFIDELKSWISLNLSAQAARDSMHSPNSIAQLLSDLNRINFRSVLMDVKEYVNVDEMDINVHESLKRILSGPDSIEPWSVWLVGLVEQRLGMSTNVRAALDGASTLDAVKKECQDLSIRWLKYMSQLKLELLLRSSGSLATFLSLELLFSNFLLHLIKVYKSRALQVPLVLYSIVRKSEGKGRQVQPVFLEPTQNVECAMETNGHNFNPFEGMQTSSTTHNFPPVQMPSTISIMFDQQNLQQTTFQSLHDPEVMPQLPPICLKPDPEPKTEKKIEVPTLSMVTIKDEDSSDE